MGETTNCVICGKRLKINKFQQRKKMCAKCSYELKKTRIKAKYWKNKNPDSKKAQLWEGRLAVINKQLKQK